MRYEETDFSDEDIQMNEPFHVPFFPEYFFPERTVRTVARHEDFYSLLLHHPPQKPVPIGPEHQAEVPSWNPEYRPNDGGGDDEVSAFTILPTPDFAASKLEKTGVGRTECYCDDKGSIRCVKRHVVEARDRLERTIGHNAFAELGFLEMGEAVAEQWSENEEQLFHQVVFSNPISTGKNFWNLLSSSFPSRTKREIVSYYFNVFMLRRRGEQNRFGMSNIDSDNDEWHISDEEDDDDSIVESPLPHAKSIVNGVFSECDDGVDKTFEKADKKTATSEYQDTQDDSCTSFDNNATSVEEHKPNSKDDRWHVGLNSLNNSGIHNYILEPCDATKIWDVGYIGGGCWKRETDFLPTCSMIKEVFGNESWNCKFDGKGP